jgi:hypothetical protein
LDWPKARVDEKLTTNRRRQMMEPHPHIHTVRAQLGDRLLRSWQQKGLKFKRGNAPGNLQPHAALPRQTADSGHRFGAGEVEENIDDHLHLSSRIARDDIHERAHFRIIGHLRWDQTAPAVHIQQIRRHPERAGAQCIVQVIAHAGDLLRRRRAVPCLQAHDREANGDVAYVGGVVERQLHMFFERGAVFAPQPPVRPFGFRPIRLPGCNSFGSIPPLECRGRALWLTGQPQLEVRSRNFFYRAYFLSHPSTLAFACAMNVSTRSTAVSIWLCGPVSTWRLRAATTLGSSLLIVSRLWDMATMAL